MMTELVLILALVAGAAEFEAQTLDGQQARGAITSLDARQVVLETAQGPATFPLDRLKALARVPEGDAQQPPAPITVELVDGTLLPAADYSVAGGRARIDAVDVPTTAIRWVRFAAIGADPKWTRQWSEIVELKPAGDLLVVKKNDAIDYLEGLLGDLNAEVCHFKLDGDDLPVKRAKVAGLVYAHPHAAELPAPWAQVATASGARLQVKSLDLDGAQVCVTTLAGTTHRLPLADVARCDFSSGKIAYLSDLEPERADFTPLVGFAQPVPGVSEFYQYRRDGGFAGEPLRLDGKVFPKGLALASRTELVYKLPDKFRVFQATVGVDDSVRATGSLQVEILGDGKSLWQGEVRGGEPARELELDIAGVKRLQIVADYGAGLDVGDRLDLAEARVTK